MIFDQLGEVIQLDQFLEIPFSQILLNTNHLGAFCREYFKTGFELAAVLPEFQEY